MEQKIKEARELLNKYYNYLMDEFNGNASEEAIELFIEEEFKHIHKNNGIDDECAICGYDLRSLIHKRVQ